MKKSFLFLAFAAAALSVQAKEAKTLFSGTVKGFDNDTVYVRRVTLDQPTSRSMDTLLAVKGSFHYDKTIQSPTEFTLYTGKCFLKRSNGRLYLPETRLIKLVMQPGGKANLTGSMDKTTLSYQVKGDAFNETFSQRRSEWLDTKAEVVRMELQIDSMATAGADEKVIDALDQMLEVKRMASLEKDLDFIRKHPDQDLSAYYLNALPMDSFLVYVDKLAPTVRRGMFAKGLDVQEQQSKSFKAVQEAQKRVAPGTVAPDFALRSIQGDTLRLSDFKGKYLVIDFWGAWCYWCMKGVPQMKEYYAKYKGKVEFIGVDVRDTEAAWKAAVEKNGLEWVHVMNLTPTDVPVLYGVSGYPTKFILDPDLKIVSRVIGESPDFYKKLDELLQ